jgi:hypothetical protein
VRNRTENHRTYRLLATIAATIVAVGAFATLGGIGLAHGVINLAQYQYGKKITICHKNKVTITISVNAWPAHQRHGDTVGPCQRTGSTGTAGAQQSGTHNGGKGHDKGGGKKGHHSSTGSSGHSNHQGGNGKGNGKGK